MDKSFWMFQWIFSILNSPLIFKPGPPKARGICFPLHNWLPTISKKAKNVLRPVPFRLLPYLPSSRSRAASLNTGFDAVDSFWDQEATQRRRFGASHPAPPGRSRSIAPIHPIVPSQACPAPPFPAGCRSRCVSLPRQCCSHNCSSTTQECKDI